VRSPDRVQLERWLLWVRARPWQVWATAGAVFVLFALLGALTRSPVPVPVGARSLSDGIERGTGSTAAPEPSATPVPDQPRSPGMAYPQEPAAPPARVPAPTPTASTYYPNCAAAVAAGAAPISRGQPGYRPELDGDGDGVACDPVGQPSSSPTTAPVSTSPAPSPSATPTPTVSPTPSPTPVPTTEPPPGVG
jgi:hypothetical protein